MPLRRSHPVTVKRVGLQKPAGAAMPRERQRFLKNLWFIGTASGVLGGGYFAGSIRLALLHGDRLENVEHRAAESAPVMRMFLAPRQKKTVAEALPPATPDVPQPQVPELAVILPESSRVVASLPPAPLPPVAVPETPSRRKSAPVVPAKKFTVALRPLAKAAEDDRESSP